MISFAQYHVDSDSNFLEKYWDYERNILNPFDISYGSNKKVWIKCQNHKYHGSYETTCKSFSIGSRCIYCNNHHYVNYFDSLGFLYHNTAKSIVEDDRNNLTWEDAYKISPGSRRKYYFKCNNCGTLNDKMQVNYIIKRSCSCKYCSDGISIPEKFIMALLNELNVKFTTQYISDWTERKRYDFYIPSLNMIIETNGEHHYGRTRGGRTLREEIENDKYKKELALLNGIENYIEINCRYSQLNWIKDNTIKELNDYFDLSNINWDEIWINCQESLCIKTWEMWNSGVRIIKDISHTLKIHRCVVREYLKRGKDIGIVDYDEVKIRKEVGRRQNGKNNPISKSYICITTKRIFQSRIEGAKYYNISVNGISNCCKGRVKSAGKYNNKKLVWKYLTWNHNKRYKIVYK